MGKRPRSDGAPRQRSNRRRGTSKEDGVGERMREAAAVFRNGSSSIDQDFDAEETDVEETIVEEIVERLLREKPLEDRDPAQSVPRCFEQLRTELPGIMASRMRHDPSNDHKSGKNIIFDPTFQQTRDDLDALSRRLQNAANQHLSDIQKSTETLRQYREKKPLVGVCGDPGQGKSRLIGALLGDPGLIFAAASGDSATNVPLEYRKLDEGAQDHKYETEIQLMSLKSFSDRVKISLANLSWSLFQYDPLDGDPERVLAAADAAKDFFRSIFLRDPRFESDENIKALLGDEENKDAREHVMMLAKAQYDLLNADKKKFPLRRTYASSSEMWAELLPWGFYDPTRTSLPFAPWPMVECIILRSRAEILQHVVLLDLPGLDDNNQFNRETTHKYLLNCDVQMIVQRIERFSNKAWRAFQHIREARQRRANSGKIILIPTMKEQIETGAGSDHRATFSAAEMDERCLIEKEMQSLTYETNQEYSNWVLKWLDFRNVTLTVQERDRRITAIWKGTKPDVEVFPVSASDYEKNLAGYWGHSSIPLLPEDTGVPRLLRYLAALPAKSQFQDVQDVANVHLAGALASISSRLRQDLISGGVPLEFSPRSIINDLRTEILTSYDQFVMNPLMKSIDMDTWIEKAKNMHREWQPESGLQNEWHFKTYQAFIAHYGDHSTRKQTHMRWNQMFLRQVKISLLPTFEEVNDNLLTDFPHTSERLLCRALEEVKDHLTTQRPHRHDKSLDSVFEAIDTRKEKVKLICREVEKDVSNMLRIERERTLQNDFGYYFREAMNPIYQEIQYLKGTRPREADYTVRIKALDAALSDKINGPFASIKKGLTVACKTQRLRTSKKICEEVQKEFNSLEKELGWGNSSQDRRSSLRGRTHLTEELGQLKQDHQKLLRVLDKLKAQYELQPERCCDTS